VRREGAKAKSPKAVQSSAKRPSGFKHGQKSGRIEHAAAVAAGIPVAVMPCWHSRSAISEAARRADDIQGKEGRASAVAAQSPRSQPEDARQRPFHQLESYRGYVPQLGPYLLRYAIGRPGRRAAKPSKWMAMIYSISGPFAL